LLKTGKKNNLTTDSTGTNIPSKEKIDFSTRSSSANPSTRTQTKTANIEKTKTIGPPLMQMFLDDNV